MSAPAPILGAGSTEPGLTVRARFALADEQAARTLAARLIDRAHELANLPEYECDVDVDVQWVAPPAPASGPARLDAGSRPHRDR